MSVEILEIYEVVGQTGPPGTTTWGGITDKPESFPPAVHTHSFESITDKPETFPPGGGAGGVLSGQFPNPGFSVDMATQAELDAGLAEKSNTGHTHDAAAIVSGTLDIARFPVLPSQKQISSPGLMADLTVEQQTEIGQGTVVTTTDGKRWVYSGAGDKLLDASYTKLADITPEWVVIENKPSAFATTAALIGDATTAGRNLLTAASIAAQKAFLAITMADVDGLVEALASLTTALDEKAEKFPDWNEQTGTTYTIALSDAGKTVRCTNAAAISLTIPENSAVAFPVGTTLEIAQGGAGKITIGGAGVTIECPATEKRTTAQHAGATLKKRGTNTWWLEGRLE